MIVMTCPECGVYIVNDKAHARWHKKIARQTLDFERALHTLRTRIRVIVKKIEG